MNYGDDYMQHLNTIQPEPKHLQVDPDIFMGSFNALQYQVHKNSHNHGFWKGSYNPAEKIALMHSELSEALEAVRKGNPPSDHLPEYSALAEELADVIIRAMDMAEKETIDLGRVILKKHAFNVSRPYKHGKAF